MGTLPSRDQVNLRTPGQAAYQGVKLAAGHFTVVRVYADFVQPASQATFSGVTARLQVLDANGNQISVWAPDTAPARLTRTACACVTDAQRADPNASFNFLTRWDETEHRSLSFRATVTPPVGIAAPRQCAGCDENTFLLTGVPFVATANVPIRPIPLTVNKVATSLTVDQVFRTAQAVLPVNLEVYGFDAPLPIDGLTGLQALAAVAKRASQDHFNSSQFPVGVFVDTANPPRSMEILGGVLNSRTPPGAIVQDANRPVTSVMHEIGHGLGLVHADTGSLVPGSKPPAFTGTHPDGSLDCGGNSPAGLGETWFPDNQGYLYGAGLDRTGWSIFQTGSLPRPVVAGFPTPGSRYYDFMSYCPAVAGSYAPTPDAVFDAEHWISVRNWNTLVAFDQPPQALPATSAASVAPHVAGGQPLRVIATVDPSGATSIFDVTPGESTAAEPTPGSPYQH